MRKKWNASFYQLTLSCHYWSVLSNAVCSLFSSLNDGGQLSNKAFWKDISEKVASSISFSKNHDNRIHIFWSHRKISSQRSFQINTVIVSIMSTYIVMFVYENHCTYSYGVNFLSPPLKSCYLIYFCYNVFQSCIFWAYLITTSNV